MIFSAKRELYFAYGSNMSSSRLCARVPSAKALGLARLDGFVWCCNKLGKDGSGKANLMQQQDSEVYGVLYEIKAKHWKQLDRVELGYQRFEVEVELAGEKRLAWSYQSNLMTANPPTPDYLSFIIDGLIEHKLPMSYVSEVRREAGI